MPSYDFPLPNFWETYNWTFIYLLNYTLDKSWLVFGRSLKSLVWEMFSCVLINVPNTITESIYVISVQAYLPPIQNQYHHTLLYSTNGLCCCLQLKGTQSHTYSFHRAQWLMTAFLFPIPLLIYFMHKAILSRHDLLKVYCSTKPMNTTTYFNFT